MCLYLQQNSFFALSLQDRAGGRTEPSPVPLRTPRPDRHGPGPPVLCPALAAGFATAATRDTRRLPMRPRPAPGRAPPSPGRWERSPWHTVPWGGTGTDPQPPQPGLEPVTTEPRTAPAPGVALPRPLPPLVSFFSPSRYFRPAPFSFKGRREGETQTRAPRARRGVIAPRDVTRRRRNSPAGCAKMAAAEAAGAAAVRGGGARC